MLGSCCARACKLILVCVFRQRARSRSKRCEELTSNAERIDCKFDAEGHVPENSAVSGRKCAILVEDLMPTKWRSNHILRCIFDKHFLRLRCIFDKHQGHLKECRWILSNLLTLQPPSKLPSESPTSSSEGSVLLKSKRVKLTFLAQSRFTAKTAHETSLSKSSRKTSHVSAAASFEDLCGKHGNSR